jgi:hypothetical protein
MTLEIFIFIFFSLLATENLQNYFFFFSLFTNFFFSLSGDISPVEKHSWTELFKYFTGDISPKCEIKKLKNLVILEVFSSSQK